MKPITPPCLRRRRPRSGWSGTMWLVVLCLLFKSGVPMLAAAAAQLRGVGVAEVCTVYGVALPPVSPGPTVAGLGPMAGMHGGMVVQGTAGTDAHDPSAAHGGGPDVHPGHQSHEHHGDLASGHDHCGLTPLMGAAALTVDAAKGDVASACDPLRQMSPVAAVPLRDEMLAWYARDAHPPPG